MSKAKILDFFKKYTMIVVLVLVVAFFAWQTDGKLLLPQNVTGAQVLKLRYSLTFSDGRCEHFDYVLSLDSAFGTGSASGADGRYLSGYSYTLSLTVSPNVITFNARTSAWTDKNDI